MEVKRDVTELRDGLNAETIQRVTGNQSIRLYLLLTQETKQILTIELVEIERQHAEIVQQKSGHESISQAARAKMPLRCLKSKKKSQALERQLNQAQKNLQALIQQKKEINQALARNNSEVKIVTQAEIPQKKIAPLQLPLLGAGLLGSLALGGLGMWIADRRDRSLITNGCRCRTIPRAESSGCHSQF